MTETQQLVKQLYKDEAGNPIILSPSQDLIFRAIAMKEKSRVHIMCHTRFGKSMDVGLAALTRLVSFPEKWAILTNTKEKSRIIMDYIIQHIFDNSYTSERFVPDKGESAESIRRHRNKNRLTFEVGKDDRGKTLMSEVFVGAAKDALGFGAPNIIEDEAALIEDPDHSLVLRMLGDNPTNNFLVKIGNPFQRNHFLKSYHDPAYLKIVVDCYQSLKEGRITEQVIEENRGYPFFKVLYECMFPSASEIDESGWQYLLTDNDIQIAQKRENQEFGTRRIGLDVARGGRNYNVWVLRTENTARVLEKNLDNDLVSVSNRTKELAKEHGVTASNVFVDDTGVGGGVTDTLKSYQMKINPVKLGEKSEDPDCANVRADVYAGKNSTQSWIKQTGKLLEHKDWLQLTLIRYKKNHLGRTLIESKDDMRKRGVESPDVADALALTFAKPSVATYHGVDPQAILAGGVPAL